MLVTHYSLPVGAPRFRFGFLFAMKKRVLCGTNQPLETNMAIRVLSTLYPYKRKEPNNRSLGDDRRQDQ